MIGNSWKGFTTVNPYHDGHLWRKYGEKAISGLTFPRCYYRCTYSPCAAKKRVEQHSNTDPPLFHVSYQGEHTCSNHHAPTSAQQHMPPLVLRPAAAAAVPAAEQFLLKVEPGAHELGEEQRRYPPPPTPCIKAEGSCGNPSAAAAPVITDACAASEATGGRDDDPWDGLTWLQYDMERLMEMVSWDYELVCGDFGLALDMGPPSSISLW